MTTTPPDVEPGFDPHKVRGIADVKRSTDDRMIAGVCSGLAKYLNIDPVVLRVVLAALTFVGFAGVVLYLAAWFLLPTDTDPKSVAAHWFKLDENEEQVRTIGLIVAGVLAVTAGAGIFDGQWSAPFPWIGIVAFALLYVWVIKPRRAKRERAGHTFTDPTADGLTVTKVLDPKEPKTPWSPVLTLVTISSSLIAMGGVAIYANAHDALPWTTYAVTALGVIAVGLLTSTFFGNGGPLIPIGALIAIALAMTAMLPSSRIGQDIYPDSTGEIASSYTLGIGELDVNLDNLSNPSQLEGRTIKVKLGIGHTRIVVPSDANVEVHSTLNAGEIRVFDRTVDGTDNTLNYDAQDPLAPKLTLDISQTLGNIEVVKQ
ncbi:MAG: PspC domain-containing protein [Aeromicrobium sp.]